MQAAKFDIYGRGTQGNSQIDKIEIGNAIDEIDCLKCSINCDVSSYSNSACKTVLTWLLIKTQFLLL